MLGAVIGDIVGSRYEWFNHRNKDFELFDEDCTPTDDSYMSLAIAEAISAWQDEDYDHLSDLAVEHMRAIGRAYPHGGYGGRFAVWLRSPDPQPYNSWGNGAAMRVSACGFAARDLQMAKDMSLAVTRVTHGHPEGLLGAEATTVAIYMARMGHSKEEIRRCMTKDYYALDFTLDEIRPTYRFNETCRDTVPQALQAFFESTDFEDAIRNAISVGGDSDTLAAITGGIAEAYYGIPDDLRQRAYAFLDDRLRTIIETFESRYPAKRA